MAGDRRLVRFRQNHADEHHRVSGFAQPRFGDVGRAATGGLETPPQLADVRKNVIGLVFQKFHLVPHLTAVENVMVAPVLSFGGRRGTGDGRA